MLPSRSVGIRSSGNPRRKVFELLYDVAWGKQKLGETNGVEPSVRGAFERSVIEVEPVDIDVRPYGAGLQIAKAAPKSGP